jgi:hypothetical protein
MKLLVLFTLILGSGVAYADHYDNQEVLTCRVTRLMDGSFFEEALTAYEYPDIDVAIAPDGEYSVDIGGKAPFEKSEGNLVTLEINKMTNGLLVTITNVQGAYVVTLEIERRTVLARGTLKIHSEKQPRPHTIAYVICDKGIL